MDISKNFTLVEFGRIFRLVESGRFLNIGDRVITVGIVMTVGRTAFLIR